MNPVPTNVTVIASPVQGFTSGNTSRIANSSGASAAADAANASATRLSRATTSLTLVSLQAAVVRTSNVILPRRYEGSRECSAGQSDVPLLHSAELAPPASTRRKDVGPAAPECTPRRLLESGR